MIKRSTLILVVLFLSVSLYTTVDGQIRLPRPPKIGIPKPPSNDTPRPPSADEAPGGQSWFSAIARFRRGYDPNLTVAEDRTKFISPYLECYAKKHSLDKNKVGSYYRTFNGVNEYEIKNILKEELPELAKLEKEFKAMFPSRPNNGKSIDDNPAIWDEILTNRDEYYQCAVNDLPDATDCNRLSDSDRVVMQSFKEDMQKTLDDIRSFSTGRNWFVRDFNDSRNEYLLAALRPSFFKDLMPLSKSSSPVPVCLTRSHLRQNKHCQSIILLATVFEMPQKKS